MYRILRGLASAAAFLVALTSARGSNIATIEAQPANTPGLTLDSSPIITAILSQPGVFNGRTYSSWGFLVNDGTGSIEIYASGALLSGIGYTPAVGDAITVTGTYAPYHQLPSLSAVTAISHNSSGNAVPDPLVRTISDINQVPLPSDVTWYMLQLDNVTIAGQGSIFGSADSPLGATITDATGSMKLYYWPSVFSVPNANLFGQAVPTYPVSMRGFVSVYNGAAEFNPVSIVPEPSVATVLMMGSVIFLRRRRCACPRPRPR